MDRDRSRIWERYQQRRTATNSDSDTDSDRTETESTSTNSEAETEQLPKMDPGLQELLTQLMNAVRDANQRAAETVERQAQQQREFMEGLRQEREQRRQEQAAGQPGGAPPPPPGPPEGAEAQRPLPEPKLTSNTFAELNLDSLDEAAKLNMFAAWEGGVRNTATALDAEARMPFARIAACILSSLRGNTALQVIDMRGNQFNDMNQLMNDLRALLCGAATRERSYNLFTEARQCANEDIAMWWSRLLCLWNRGFIEPRPVPTLIRAFVENLADKRVQEKLITREQGIPDNYAELKTLTLEISGKEDTLRLVRKARGQGHRIPLVEDKVVPMDCNAAAKGRRGGGAKVAVNNTNAGANTGRGAGRKRVDPDQCLKCHKKGHWKKDCPEKDKGKKVFLVTGADEPQDQHVYQPDDSDDEDDWAGVAATQAGNGQAQAQSHQA